MSQSTPTYHDSADVPFTIAATVIPAGIRCGACGRLHLPHRLTSIDRDGGDDVWLKCAHCGATGPLEADPSLATHAEVLRAVLREEVA